MGMMRAIIEGESDFEYPAAFFAAFVVQMRIWDDQVLFSA
jgi:hypothetical protein